MDIRYSQKYLIVNADDLGLCKSQNSAIDILYKKGRITSSTVLAPADEVFDAKEKILDSGISVGVHWTLNSEYSDNLWNSCADWESVPSITEGGKLFYDKNRMAKDAKPSDITTELEAQYKKLVSLGIKPDHADSHSGTLYGTNKRMFFINAFKVCRKYDLPFRFPIRGDFLTRQFGEGVPGILKAFHKVVVFIGRSMGVSLIDDMITNPDSVEKLSIYENLRDYYVNAMSEIKPGITEMFLHPSLEDDDMLSRSKEWQKRIWEYQFLLSDDFEKAIEKNNIRLVSWSSAPFK